MRVASLAGFRQVWVETFQFTAQCAAPMRARLVCIRYPSYTVAVPDKIFGLTLSSILSTAATRSGRFSRHRRRSHRSCSVTFLLLNSDLSVSLHRTTKYVILSEALAESKNLRIFNAA